jgi:hypothetical protein
MCIVCDLGKSPSDVSTLVVKSFSLGEIKGTTLDISGCKKVREIQVPEGLQKLSCDGCTNLTSLGSLPEGLRILSCNYCTNLTSLEPLPESLRELHCIGCTNLTSLGLLPESLRELFCSYCTNLTSLGPLPQSLRELHCCDCRVLTQVGPQSVIDNLQYYSPAIWTPSENLENNLKKLVIAQNFSRSFRTRKLLRLSKTRKFCEWFYHPENYGGRWVKMSLMKMVGEVSTTTDGEVSTTTDGETLDRPSHK